MAARSKVVVTGGAGGIGHAIATAFAADGAEVVVLDLAVAAGADVRSIACDVTDPSAVDTAMMAAADGGSISTVINAAGLTLPGSSEDYPVEDWERVIDVNLNGAFFVARAASPWLVEGSCLLNISSVSAVRLLPGRAAYSASKAAVNAMTGSLAVEWAPRGIRVNAVAPAWVDNAFLAALEERGTLVRDDLRKRIPLGRLCSEVDVVEAVRFLADSTRAGFITGQVLYVDGGYVPAG